MNIIINKDESFITDLTHAMETNNNLTDWELFKLNYEVKQATIATEFSKLQVSKYLPHMTFLDHQISTAKTVIDEMNGRAILADEVGLGKTIEAGLILKEYIIRGSVKNVLLLVPASLVSQWIKELNEKFYIPAVAYRKNYAWDEYPFYVTSIDLAKREPHRQALIDIDFDMVIIDEAHKLKNHKTVNHSFVRALKKKYCLLLTATPIQNKVIELFNLVSILKPGYLGSYEQFTKKHGKKANKLQDAYLNKLIKKVMVRNLRKDTILSDVKRSVHNVWLEFTEPEKAVYDDLTAHLATTPTLAKITFLKELCSSREACFLSLQKNEMNNEEILTGISGLPQHIKAKKLVELIQSFGQEKVIVFTEYRATQFYLQWYLQQHDITSIAFRGGLKRGRKDWITELFKQDIQVLIATEAGGEGINLQFCHHLINYDLPWNPMRLEQRIGRIHRYGQKNDVQIYNFAIKETIEAHIMNLLYDKLKIFERVIGELDHILAALDITSIDDEIKSILSHSTSDGEVKIKLNNFVSVLNDGSTDNAGDYHETN